MALPADVLDPAISLVATYCATKVPAEHHDKLRIEYKARGNTITIWTLYARDRNDRRLEYPFIEPARDLAPLLRELDDDPTCIFWG
jgi:hypothetical protein